MIKVIITIILFVILSMPVNAQINFQGTFMDPNVINGTYPNKASVDSGYVDQETLNNILYQLERMDNYNRQLPLFNYQPISQPATQPYQYQYIPPAY